MKKKSIKINFYLIYIYIYIIGWDEIKLNLNLP